MSTPIDTVNVAMDNSWISFLIDNKWKTVIIKMRETDVILTVRADDDSGDYFSIAIGSELILTSDDFTTSDFIEVKAPSGTLEMLGFLR